MLAVDTREINDAYVSAKMDLKDYRLFLVTLKTGGENLWEAIKFANIELYQAKSSGRNRVVRVSREIRKEGEY